MVERCSCLSTRPLNDHLGKSYHRQRLSLWWCCRSGWRPRGDRCRAIFTTWGKQAKIRWYHLLARDAQYAVGDPVWLYNPCKKPGLTPNYWEGPYTILQRLSAITYKLGDGTSRQPPVLSTSTVCGLPWRKGTSRGASREVFRRHTVRWRATARRRERVEQTMLQSVLSASREGREQEAASEPRVSRPLRTKKRPQWWTDCVCESKDELSRLALKVFFFFLHVSYQNA